MSSFKQYVRSGIAGGLTALAVAIYVFPPQLAANETQTDIKEAACNEAGCPLGQAPEECAHITGNIVNGSFVLTEGGAVTYYCRANWP